MNWGIAMRNQNTDEQMLDDLFAAAQSQPAEPSPAFMARVLADADMVQEGFAASEALNEPAETGFSLRAVFATLGGWPALSGLVTATAVGVWLGLTPLTNVSDTAATYLYGDSALNGLDADYAWLDTLGDA